VYSLTLPHTPPKKSDSVAWVEALRLLSKPFVLVLWIVTFIDASVHQCFFSWTFRFLSSDGVRIPANWAQPVMSIGQVSEILTMLILGVTLKKLGWKPTMIVGILGHAVRFGVFAFLPELMPHSPAVPWIIALINILHGICYAFFFATVYIFVDEFFPKDVRSSAQGLFNFMILGLGMLVPNFVCPWLFDDVYTKGGVTNFKGLFLVPSFLALAAIVILALFFHPPRQAEDTR
jgi:MFS family permease